MRVFGLALWNCRSGRKDQASPWLLLGSAYVSVCLGLRGRGSWCSKTDMKAKDTEAQIEGTFCSKCFHLLMYEGCTLHGMYLEVRQQPQRELLFSFFYVGSGDGSYIVIILPTKPSCRPLKLLLLPQSVERERISLAPEFRQKEGSVFHRLVLERRTQRII